MKAIVITVAICAAFAAFCFAPPATSNGQPLPEYAALEQRITALETWQEYTRRDWQAFVQPTISAACQHVTQAAAVQGAVIYRCRRANADIVTLDGASAKVPVTVWVNGQGKINLTVSLHRGDWSLNGIVAE